MQGYTPATSGLNDFSASFNKSKQIYPFTATKIVWIGGLAVVWFMQSNENGFPLLGSSQLQKDFFFMFSCSAFLGSAKSTKHFSHFFPFFHFAFLLERPPTHLLSLLSCLIDHFFQSHCSCRSCLSETFWVLSTLLRVLRRRTLLWKTLQMQNPPLSHPRTRLQCSRFHENWLHCNVLFSLLTGHHTFSHLYHFFFSISSLLLLIIIIIIPVVAACRAWVPKNFVILGAKNIHLSEPRNQSSL